MVRTDDISVALRDHNGPGVAPGKKSNYYRLGHYAPARGQESGDERVGISLKS